MSERTGLNKKLFWLYEGTGRAPYFFRLGLLVFDVLTIAYFFWAPFQDRGNANQPLDYVIGAVIAADLLARFYIEKNKGRFFEKIVNWADLIVVATMFAPLFTQNYAFLRLLRAIRIVRAFTVLRRMKRLSAYLRERETIVDRVVNLIVFVFFMSAFVYVAQVEGNESINNYVDALYFTVSSLTTTGYGDIIMEGVWGKLLSVAIMVLGLTLFLRLLRALAFSRAKVDVECERCGLGRHDPDAIHCKHCGEVVHIDTMGR